MYTGDRSLENLKDFVKDLINTHLHSHKPHDPIEESGSFPSDPVAIEVPDTTDDVSCSSFVTMVITVCN